MRNIATKKTKTAKAGPVRPDADARSVAMDVLRQVVHGNVDAQDALDRALQQHTLSFSDSRLCTELVYGTLRQKIRLDWFLRPFLQNPDRLPAEVILALEMALYEFFFLRVPVHASFDRAVAAAKRRFGARMGGLVNAVLRNAQRKADTFFCEQTYTEKTPNTLTEAIEGTDLDAFTRMCSMPAWIGGMWAKAYGNEKARALLRSAARSAPAGVRVRPGALTLLPEELERCVFRLEDTAFAFEGSLPDRFNRAVQEGNAARQSAASFEVLRSLEPGEWAEPVWDCCAGRGGKTLALLESGVDVALASDVSGRRLRGLLDDARRLGYGASLPVAAGSAVDIAQWLSEGESARTGESKAPIILAGEVSRIPARFGTVLVDAPCSGLGTLSRHPEIRLRRSMEDVKGLAAAQNKILRAAATRVRPGGNLVYITCTLTPEENEEQVANFLKENPAVEVVRSFVTPVESPLREYFYGVCLRLP